MEIATLSFECTGCGNDVDEEGFDLPGYDYSSEVHSDGLGTEIVYVTCPSCDKEYEISISNMFDQFEIEIVSEQNVPIALFLPPDEDDEYNYEEFLKSYVPPEPRERYEHSVQLLDDMVEAAGTLNSYPMFHRMLLLQHVAMMEAYLCDRLITLVEVESIRTNLIKGYSDLKNQKFSLEAFTCNSNLVKEKTVNFLKSQLFHDLDAVEKMYQSALGSSPFPDQEIKAFLKSVTINRHHCVHRDGKTSNGDVLEEVNTAYIEKVRKSLILLVQYIETIFSEDIAKVRPKSPPF